MLKTDPISRLSRAMRELQDCLASTSAPEQLVDSMAARLEELTAEFNAYRAPVVPTPTFGLGSVPRGAFCRNPELTSETWSPDRLDGEMTFTAFHLGANGSAHGGSVSLLFDGVLGRLANEDGVWRRNAYLKIDFRSLTPLETPLRVEGFLVRSEGRKFWYGGRLWNGEILAAEADALFLTVPDGGY
ncbi:MAG: PaaI family thioesterase [Actinomycetes bacterium]